MKMKYTFLLLLATITTISALEDDRDSMDIPLEVENLKKRIDSLEVQLEKQSMNSFNRNPIISGEYLNWGKGVTIWGEYPYPSIDVGYTFKIANNMVRLGVFVGYDYRLGIYNEQNELPNVSRHFLHFKVMAGSPVFFNLMSFSGAVAQLYFLDQQYKDGRKQALSCSKANVDFECWIYPNLVLSFGLNVYIYEIDTTTVNRKFITSDTFKVGFKYYFGT